VINLTLNLVVSDAMEAMEFYEKVFGAIRGEVYQFPGKTGENEANVIVGGVKLRLLDENAAYDCHPPKKEETESIWLQIVVENTDATLEKAVANGAAVGQEPSEFMGTRHAQITDPFGYTWTINQTLQEISFEERYRMYEEMQSQTE
jgi:PhnB protein